MLTGLWGAFSWVAVRQWRADRAGARRDEQVKRLLSGALVPVPRAAADDLSATEPAG